MRERLRYWRKVLRAGVKPLYSLAGLLTVIAGGSALAVIGTIISWSTVAIIAIAATAAVVAVIAVLEGAYSLRYQTSDPDIRITRGRVATAMRPVKIGAGAVDIGLHHAEIANRGNQAVHLEFIPRALWPAGGEAPAKSADDPIPNAWFEAELWREWESNVPHAGALLGSRVRVEPQSVVEGFLAWGWMEDADVLDAEIHYPRNVRAVDVIDLISGVTWRDIPLEFNSRGEQV